MEVFNIRWDGTAQFFSNADFPVPQNSEIGFIHGEDGAALRMAVIYPETHETEKLRGCLVLMTGYSEYIEKYVPIGQIFARHGYVVVIPEWRGHGDSFRPSQDKQRLHLVDFDTNRSDLQIRLARLVEAGFPTSFYGLAHSMGGQIALRTAAQWPEYFRALALSAPMLGIALGWPRLLLLHLMGLLFQAAGRLDRYAPSDPPTRNASNPLQNFVTHNDALWQMNEKFLAEHKHLQVNGRSIGWSLAVSRIMRASAKPQFLANILTPIFIGSASDEKLVDNDAIHHAVSILPNAEHVHYENAMHELLMEFPQTRDRFISDCLNFFEQH